MKNKNQQPSCVKLTGSKTQTQWRMKRVSAGAESEPDLGTKLLRGKQGYLGSSKGPCSLLGTSGPAASPSTGQLSWTGMEDG